MASRRASVRLLEVLRHNGSIGARSGQTAKVGVPAQASISFRRCFAADGQVARDVEHPAEHHAHDHEKSKMLQEGGGTGTSYTEAKDSLKQGKENVVEKGKQAMGTSADEASEVAGNMKGEASKELDTAKDSLKQGKENMVEKGKQAIGTSADEASEVAGNVKGQASKELDTAKDMTKDVPRKVSETATGLKEVGVEAAKAVKRDATRLAEKVGLKNSDQ